MSKEINEDNIRVAAYYIWEQAGRPEGADKECWIKAVEQLFSAKGTCKKASCKSAAKVAAKPIAKKNASKTTVKTIKQSASAKASSLNMPFYGAKKK